MSIVTLTRWTARGLTCLLALFFGFFLIAHLVGDAGRPTRPLNSSDYIILTSLVASLLGLLLAWKWERLGAGVALIAIAICAVVNWKVMIFPGTLIPTAALLYLISSWMRRRSTIAVTS